ncbi:hypothetical protein L1987_21272 [Smallanthus sonchifolius]|uniref:Uncharacterized protein n=1 Tax=Smallanthus sonchifolius TaxID=185202 RepID=A0ACB9IVK9_9ASTR|nr:hypothetical protein L1987_21272 [Smallanthus sonchifolius]
MPTGSSETVKHAFSTAGKKPYPSHENCSQQKSLVAIRAEEQPEELQDHPVHGLRNYGKVKDQTVENLLPDFDFDHTIGRRLNSVTGTHAVVVMVVDAVDFDGSFPRKVAELVSNTIDVNSRAWKKGKSGNLPDLGGVMQGYDI